MALGGIKVGDKVACIFDGSEPWWKRIGRPWPRKGRVYTVRSLGWGHIEELSLKLEEVPSRRGQGWRARFFRKVQPRDLDVWLATASGVEEPKKAKRKMRA